MGKPFAEEINAIHQTVEWANSIDPEFLKKKIGIQGITPAFIVGSGGSLSACHYASLLFQNSGVISKALTPLELYHATNALKNARVLFLSASGNNNDILFGFKSAIQVEPNSIISICMKKKSKLASLSSLYSLSEVVEFDIPSGKDGFLATNSLLAYYILFFRAFENQRFNFSPRDIHRNQIEELNKFVNKLTHDHSLTILYGGWGQPVGLDIESKCTEAALCNTLPTDYRNFGHGRHHWFAKRQNSAVVALVTPQDELLAQKTLKELPSNIPRLIIQSNINSSSSSIELLIRSYLLVQRLGEMYGIDPGRPGVPEFGQKLYNLRYSKFYSQKKKEGISQRTSIAIRRKANIPTLEGLSKKDFLFWKKSYDTFIFKLNMARFGSLILDYDGTLCSTRNRYDGLTEPISKEIIRILEAGFVIGIATGRGRSVRTDLQNTIPKELWNKVLIGYYNGAEIGLMSENSLPNLNLPMNQSISEIYKLISQYKSIHGLCLALRPHQLSIGTTHTANWINIKSWLYHVVHTSQLNDIRVVESAHSIDIIPRLNSKISIIEYCIELSRQNGLPSEYLCIGDKGKWPGNDFEILNSEFSLSVSDVSLNHNTCWNLASVGKKNVVATLEYLTRIRVDNGSMKIKIPK